MLVPYASSVTGAGIAIVRSIPEAVVPFGRARGSERGIQFPRE